jgi:broad specificity phosphatase PhoE
MTRAELNLALASACADGAAEARESIASWLESKCSVPLAIVVGETKQDYGKRLCKAIAAVLRPTGTAEKE